MQFCGADMSEKKDNGNDDLPEWAKWLRRQLNGVNFVIAGLVVVAGTIAALWASIPDLNFAPDCNDYANLEPHQQEECETDG